MKEETYKAAVGTFALGGIAIFVIGMMLLGGGKLLDTDMEYVLYFDGAVNGLSIGAPVVFRGVPMGRVTRISLVANSSDSNVTIPVHIRIEEKSIVRPSGEAVSEDFQREIIRRMIQRGLRARLQMQSLITGQYRVELDFHPKTIANFRSTTPAMEIPTIPSQIDTFQRTIASLPLEDMVRSLSSILLKLSNALEGDSLKRGLDSFAASFAELQHILHSSNLSGTLPNAIKRIDNTGQSLERELPIALNSFNQAMTNLAKAANEIQKGTSSAQLMLDPNSATMSELRRLLKEVSAAARSLHELSDMLRRNPEVLIQGKRGAR